jgi:alkyl hydroperoxide reductase subunit AhpF
MLSARARISSVVSKRTFATAAVETPKKQPVVDQKFKVVVVGGGPGGLSGNIRTNR